MSPKTGKLRLDAYMRTSRLGDRDADKNLSKDEQWRQIDGYCQAHTHTVINAEKTR
jgi:hypothetical protein